MPYPAQYPFLNILSWFTGICFCLSMRPTLVIQSYNFNLFFYSVQAPVDECLWFIIDSFNCSVCFGFTQLYRFDLSVKYCKIFSRFYKTLYKYQPCLCLFWVSFFSFSFCHSVSCLIVSAHNLAFIFFVQ